MRLALLFFVLLFSNLLQAATPINGWYSSVFGGYAYTPNNVHVTRYGITRNNAVYKSGFDAGGSFGYKSNPLRYEGEITYLQADLKKFTLDGLQQTGVGGYDTAILAMANVYYDFSGIVTESIQPFLGLGIGYGWVRAKLDASGPTAITTYRGTNSVFAYQGTAGLTYNFSETYALYLAYRYVATDKAGNLGKIFQAQLANVGVVYRFDGNSYK